LFCIFHVLPSSQRFFVENLAASVIQGYNGLHKATDRYAAEQSVIFAALIFISNENATLLHEGTVLQIETRIGDVATANVDINKQQRILKDVEELFRELNGRLYDIPDNREQMNDTAYRTSWRRILTATLLRLENVPLMAVLPILSLVLSS
jgi:hypothetical protein